MDEEARPAKERVILFDGECNLCNSWVDFVIRRDPAGQFHFAALQSDAARARLPAEYTQSDALGTIVLLDGEQLLVQSNAALAILARLGLPWSLARLLRIVPRPLRDAVYRFVAARRLDWFGKRDHCRLPTPEERARFL